MAKKPFMKRLQAQQEMKKNSAVVSDIEKVIANKQPDEQSHDIAAHQIMADIARPDIEPDGQIIRVDINLVYAETVRLRDFEEI
ncbi:putative partitioning protein ParB, partial [Salmonella enterica subsp. enterica serovar Saintpaul str. SARA29]